MKKAIVFLLAGASFLACTRDTATLGPNLSDVYGPFLLFEDFDASTNQVDFASGESVLFTCRFNKAVNWEIHLIGQKSGAENIISGRSNKVDQDNGRWIGTTTNLPMFKVEDVLAYITVPEEGYSDTLAGLITINSVKIDNGFVVADFETGLNPGWDVFKQSGGNMSFTIEENDSSAQGTHYYDMGGMVNFDYLIGYIYFPADAYGASTFPLSSNPNTVFFNVMLNKPQGITNEIILFRFREDENGDGIHQAASEDMYSIELKGIEANWQTISLKYAEMVALVNGQPATPAGNGIHEPDKLLQIEVLFLADPASGYSQTFMDYMIFTENGPLVP